MKFCCKMRQRFLVGIIAEDASIPMPYAVQDFVDYSCQSPEGKPVLKIRYCPFCGKGIGSNDTVRLVKK